MHIGHMIAHAMVNGLIYATIFKLSHQLGLVGMIGLAVIVIALLWIVVRLIGGRG